MNIRQVLLNVPIWHVVRLLAVVVLVVALWSPVRELLAIKKSVVFFCGDEATIAWDPPSEGIVDHYVVRMEVVKPIRGEQNFVSWTKYIDVYSTSFSWTPEDGHNYSFRVQSVGPNGEKSEFSEEELVVIADCSAPQVNLNPFQALKNVKTKGDAIGGTYSDRNIAYIKIDGQNALLDIVNGFWQAGLKLRSLREQVSIAAADYAGNSFTKSFAVSSGPLVIDSDPGGGSLYLMGSPEFPGIFLTDLPLTLNSYPETSFYVPVNIRVPRMMPAFVSIRFPPGTKNLTYRLAPFNVPAGFTIEGRDDIRFGQGADIFMVNLDGDDSMELLSCSSEGVSIIDNGETKVIEVQGYEDAPLGLSKGCSLFMLDYDDDLKYELTMFPGAFSKKIYLFEENSGKWMIDGEIFGENNLQCMSGRYTFTQWDGDGKKDILVEDCDGHLHLFLNKRSDNAPRYEGADVTLDLADRKRFTAIQFMDWNADGSQDLLGLSQNGQLVVWPNKGDNTFSKAQEIVSLVDYGLEISSFKCGDLNMDGVPDFVLMSTDGQFFILWGTQ